MYEIVQGKAVGEWVAKEIQGHYCAEVSQAIGLQKDGEIVAGVIYEDWNQVSITCHLAIIQSTRKFFKSSFAYAFESCGARKIIAPVAEGNLEALALVKNMGFTLEATIKDAQPKGDILIFTMTANQCRFLNKKYADKE